METTRFQIGRHMVVAIAIGVLAPFTLWAWPFAIATGIVIGTADVEKSHGQTASRSTRFVRIVAVTGGVLAMFVAGAFSAASSPFLSPPSPSSRSKSRPMLRRPTGTLPGSCCSSAAHLAGSFWGSPSGSNSTFASGLDLAVPVPHASRLAAAAIHSSRPSIGIRRLLARVQHLSGAPKQPEAARAIRSWSAAAAHRSP